MADNDDYMVAKPSKATITELMWDRVQEGINANRRYRLRGVAGGDNMRYDTTKVVWDTDIYIYFTRESDGGWVYNKINANPTTGITCNDDDLLYVTLNDTNGTTLTVSAADYTAMLTDDTGRVLVLGAVSNSTWYGYVSGGMIDHASTHEDGGGDEISVAGLSGDLADAQDPKTHASSHQDTGSDEISVAGLSGLLADSQNPLAFKPYKNVETINARPAVLLFADYYDEYPTTYDEDKPPFWHYGEVTTGDEDADDFFKLENVNFGGHDGMKIMWRSRADDILTIFAPPLPSTMRCIVIKAKNFYYDDIGSNDRFIFNIQGVCFDASAGTVVRRDMCVLNAENNQYYHYPGGTKTSTGWGDPETLGYHDLTFFVAAMVSTYAPPGDRVAYRIECTGKTAVSGAREDVWDSESDIFLGWHIQITPVRSTGWDIDAYLRGIEIYSRDNMDL